MTTKKTAPPSGAKNTKSTSQGKKKPQPKKPQPKAKSNSFVSKFDTEIAIISLVAFGLLIYIMSFVSSTGYVSNFLKGVFFGVFGFGTFLIPILIFYYASMIFKNHKITIDFQIIVTLIIFLLMIMTFTHLIFAYETSATVVFSMGYDKKIIGTGGFLGALFGNFLSSLFGKVISYIITITITIICLVLITRKSFVSLTVQAGSSLKKGVSRLNIKDFIKNIFNRDDDYYDDDYDDEEEEDFEEEFEINPVQTIEREMENYKREIFEREQEELSRLRRMEKKYKKLVKKQVRLQEKNPKIIHTLRKSTELEEQKEYNHIPEEYIENVNSSLSYESSHTIPTELPQVTSSPEELELLKRKRALEQSYEEVKKDLQEFYRNLATEPTVNLSHKEPKTIEIPNIEPKEEEPESKEVTQRVATINEDFFSRVVKPSKIYQDVMKEDGETTTEDTILANLYKDVIEDKENDYEDIEEEIENIPIQNISPYALDNVEEDFEESMEPELQEEIEEISELYEEDEILEVELDYNKQLDAIRTYTKEDLEKPISYFKSEEESKEEPEVLKVPSPDLSLKQNIKQVDKDKPFTFPSYNVLQKGVVNTGVDYQASVEATSRKLEETLLSFGVKAKVMSVSRGPSVTRYEVQPGVGVKVSKIANLSDDLALNLAAQDIRIQAPIPGKQAVGIEVPNSEVEMVYLRDILDTQKFKSFPSNLAFGIGKDIAGNVVVHDIAKMPHLLVAGATGSGKSVCINTLIASILYKSKPNEVKLIMIDPKVVELSIYNGIPHLLIPVVTDPKKANAALQWAVIEMEKRFASFSESNVRNLTGYNQWLKDNGYDELPSVVIIIDELADLMMTSGKEVEDSICRLAQKARAAGIHLIVATQRPSVDVITGLIKANIPSRLAFAVSSGIDSRTILDSVGAERLLGKGDMLFSPMGSNEPIRIQGAFVSDNEVEKIVEHLKSTSTVEVDESLLEEITNVNQKSDKEVEAENRDALFYEAMDYLIERDRASTSMLQTKFSIGYNRASRLIESFADAGYIGEQEGSKPRKILVTFSQWEDIKNQ